MEIIKNSLSYITSVAQKPVEYQPLKVNPSSQVLLTDPLQRTLVRQ